MEINNLTSSILFTIGGSNVAIAGIFGFLGYIWSRRILQREKLEHDKELKKIESKLSFEKSRKEKISDERFSLYTEVWHAVQDLKTVADRLWVRATSDILFEFITVLSETKRAVNRGRLILREEHYKSLKEVIEHFNNYRFGKELLVKIRTKTEVDKNFGAYLNEQNATDDIIAKNHDNKNKYDLLLNEIVKQFRLELGLSTLNSADNEFLKDDDILI
jgi:hypothetical protein